jgi:hypothetical protein
VEEAALALSHGFFDEVEDEVDGVVFLIEYLR